MLQRELSDESGPVVIIGCAGIIQEMFSAQPNSHTHDETQEDLADRDLIHKQSRGAFQLHFILRIQVVNM